MKLDQAIALVPDRWEWSVGSGNTVYGDRAWANVWPCDQPFPNDCDIFEEGSDPADALEKAATRAKTLVSCRVLGGWFTQQFATGVQPDGFGGKE